MSHHLELRNVPAIDEQASGSVRKRLRAPGDPGPRASRKSARAACWVGIGNASGSAGHIEETRRTLRNRAARTASLSGTSGHATAPVVLAPRPAGSALFHTLRPWAAAKAGRSFSLRGSHRARKSRNKVDRILPSALCSCQRCPESRHPEPGCDEGAGTILSHRTTFGRACR